MLKTAFITGVTGQDGAYLTRFLLKKGYQVHGLKRRCSSFNTARIDDIYPHDENPASSLKLHFGDLTDSTSLTRILEEVQPDEVYNLAAQSHVRVSFDMPEFTGDVNGLGVLRILEAIRSLGLTKTRFYQASTSELFGAVRETPQRETTPFAPRSPYAIAKLFGYWTTVNYREAYNVFASNGILFNHESPLRGETFVTRKITRCAARLEEGLTDQLQIGNLDAQRDWGHAADYVEGMWSILQHDRPDDFVLATGESHSVREFIELVFQKIGRPLVWQGNGLEERGIEQTTGIPLVVVNPKYFRPAEVEFLCGDASKAKKELGWEPRHSFEDLVDDMLCYDRELLQRPRCSERIGPE